MHVRPDKAAHLIEKFLYSASGINNDEAGCHIGEDVRYIEEPTSISSGPGSETVFSARPPLADGA